MDVYDGSIDCTRRAGNRNGPMSEPLYEKKQKKKKKEKLIIEIPITSPPWGHQISHVANRPTSTQYGSGLPSPRCLVINLVFRLCSKRFPPLPRNSLILAVSHPPINIPNNSQQNIPDMAGSLIYDSTFTQFLPLRPSPPRRRDQVVFHDAQNMFLAGPFDRRPSPPANLYEGLPPHPNDVAVSSQHHRSRSERSRKAMSVPVRHPSSVPPSTPQNNFRAPHPGDIGPPSSQRSFPWVHDEVIAEFSPRDQLALSRVLAGAPNQNRPSSRPPSAQNPLPPRLKVNPRQSRSRNWRSNDAESLPPRFRSPQSAPGPRVPSPPFTPPWNRPPHANLSRVDVNNNNNVPAFSHLPPHLSQPQRLSSFLQSNVSYRPQQIIDTRREQNSKRIDISPKVKTLAPIGAERAQLLASNPKFCPVNNCTPHNYRQSSPAHSYSYDPLLQTIRPGHLNRAPQLPAGPSELEKLYNRLKRTPNVSRILSPLNPIRNPESLNPSDAKLIKEEREIRRRRVMTSLDTSAFARRAGDRRSRT